MDSDEVKNIDKTLFERACVYIHSLEEQNLDNLDENLSLQTFMGADEIMHLSVSYYNFARDAMPKEIVDFVLGNIYIGFIMGCIACGDNSEENLIINTRE